MFRRKATQPTEVTWLFVGLGNPGGEYDGTRHNVGFEVIRRLAERNGITVSLRKHRSVYGFGKIGEAPVALAKPMTFMNLSGIACASLCNALRVPPSQMVVIYDDMDLALGRVQVKPKGGPGSHNGMRSIVEVLETRDFPRVRIGIGSPMVTGVDHVLSRFTDEEIPNILDALSRATTACEMIATDGIDLAMNRTNLPEKPSEPEPTEE